MSEEPDGRADGLERGRVAPALAAEFPKLALFHCTEAAAPGRSPTGVKRRLRELSSRFSGPAAVQMRQAAVPQAYRVFFRSIGLDPDVQRPPGEEAAVARLMHGGFRSRSLLDDALLLAVVETGVPVWALDAAHVEGPLELRAGVEGERLGRSEDAPHVPGGRLVIADAEGPLAVLFGDLAPGHGVTRKTEAITLFTVAVPGVPAIHVEEAMATCRDVLTSA